MKIDGKLIAQTIKDQLKIEILQLRQREIVPHLAVILVGDDPSSVVYVGQKKKVAQEIGAKLTLYNLPKTIDMLELQKLTLSLNTDPLVHGLIIQRPMPPNFSAQQIDFMVKAEKDIDGFHPQTPFVPPVAGAVVKILQWVANDVATNPQSPLKQNFSETFPTWLSKQKILVIGRGVTAGKPIAAILIKNGAHVDIAHSQTKFMDALIRASNIIISCVGSPNIVRLSSDSPRNGSSIVRQQDITPKSILIGVGLHTTEEGKLQTDYDQEKIASIAAYYTPVPGGVGPVNVACLFENLLKAVEDLSLSI